MKRVWSDENKYDKWLQIEIATCEAWADDGVIPHADMEKLRGATYNKAHFEKVLKETRHELTAFLTSITEFSGAEGRWLHLGLTTSDVWDTATSLQLVESAELLDEGIVNLMSVLGVKALEHKDTMMVGRTHGIHAEPITFGLKLAVWWDEMRRNRERLAHAKQTVSVGMISGPVGTHATVPPNVEARVCGHLGLEVAAASTQVIQRDRHAQFITTLALISASLEKFATEIRGLQRTEIGEVAEPFPKGQPGSSSMPHKRNPELSERICGLARLIRGHSVTSMENVALWAERDISHSSNERIILQDSCLALDYILDLFAGVMRDLSIFPDHMKKNLESTRGILFSQRVLLALVEKGVAREEAYSTVHDRSMESWANETDFRDLVRADIKITSKLTSEELDRIFDYSYFVRHVDEIFERVGIK
jgi:adenylosuccinate lyase